MSLAKLLALPLFTFVFLAGTHSAALADDTASGNATAENVAAPSEKTVQIRDLLYPEAPESAEVFAETVKKARALGATDQQLLEAEVFRVLVHGKEADLSALGTRLEKAAAEWDTTAALAIPNKTLVTAFVHTLRARAALLKNDTATFRTESGEALLLEPQLGGLLFKNYQDVELAKALQEGGVLAALDKAIASGDDTAIRKAFTTALWHDPAVTREPALERLAAYQQAKKQANLRVPLDVKFAQAEGDPVSLADLLKGKKAVLLDFHASWCGPCMSLLPLLPKKADELGPKGVVVVAFNVENVADAKAIKNRFKFTLPVLVEKDSVYSQLLDVDSIPRYVLIGADGKVLFNGHPTEEDKLQEALKGITN